jgi:hypothetical protein
MKLSDIAKKLGKQAYVAFDSYSIQVLVNDARNSFGRIDYLVSPVSGKGEFWVSSERVSFNPFAGKGADMA